MNNPSDLRDFERGWALIRDDILAFCDLINFRPTTDQKEILLAIEDATLRPASSPERIIVKAGTGTGKSRLSAVAAIWRLIRCYGTKIVVTAPTERQVRTVLLAEMRSCIRDAPTWFQELFEIHETRINLTADRDWRVLPITASEATAVQGQHHPGLAIFVEEVSGIDDEILKAFLRTLSQPGNLITCIGNPNHRSGTLFRAFTNPNAQAVWPRRFTMNKLRLAEERPDLVDPDSIRQTLDEFGADSDTYRVGVLGEFPLTEGSTVLDYGDIQRSLETPIQTAIRQASNPYARRIAVDYARFGGDRSVIVRRMGNAVTEFWAGIEEPLDTTMRAFNMQETANWSNQSCTYIPDAVGLGQSMLVQYNRAKKQMIPYGSHYKPTQPNFHNAESQAWFALRHLMATEPVSLPYHADLVEQLSTRVYEYVPATNAIKVESKKDYRKRTGMPSPDEADALVQAFFETDAMQGELVGSGMGQYEAQVRLLGGRAAMPQDEDRGDEPPRGRGLLGMIV